MSDDDQRRQQLQRLRHGRGFIAALDQSGGNTPGALSRYGLESDAYSSDAEMFELMHGMRERIIASASFHGDRVIGAILFEDTMHRLVDDVSLVSYLWSRKQIVPFLKVDSGLDDERHGVRTMKPMPALTELLAAATAQGVFGTKMRSLITDANGPGIGAAVAQQFDAAHQILESGLVPILEPEVDIHSPAKAAAEDLLRAEILRHLDELAADHYVMLKLTLPDRADHYAELVGHPQVLRVLALSGGYEQDEATDRLAANHGVIASFSRALTAGLTAEQSDAQFDATLAASIERIYQASLT